MNKTIAVFFGGRSTEHDISIITALSSVIKPLELTKKYNVVPVYISRDGKWFSDDKLKNIKVYRSGAIDGLCSKIKPLSVVFDGGMTLRKQGFTNKDIEVDVAFPAMHGTYGEDGSLMGLLRMANVPFVGCDMQASVVAMDKSLSKQIALVNDIPTSKFISFSKSEFKNNSQKIIDEITNSLVFPQFVKPAHLGSSIGIAKVFNEDELFNAIEVAAYYDEKIIVEESVENLIEVTVPIIGNDNVKVAFVEKPLSRDDTFFDFETKYMNNGKKSGGKKQASSQGYSQLPAELPDGLYDKSIELAKKVYSIVGCDGIARIDLLIDSISGVVYFNEINPLPGSLYAHNWRASGVSTVDLVELLIGYAEDRHKKNQDLDTAFKSNFLKQF